MTSVAGFRLYFGYPGWGWRMYGIGYETDWFLGLSLRIKGDKP
jgi:hypothetical protein